jgi:hypothetical protein
VERHARKAEFAEIIKDSAVVRIKCISAYAGETSQGGGRRWQIRI